LGGWGWVRERRDGGAVQSPVKAAARRTGGSVKRPAKIPSSLKSIGASGRAGRCPLFGLWQQLLVSPVRCYEK